MELECPKCGSWEVDLDADLITEQEDIHLCDICGHTWISPEWKEAGETGAEETGLEETGK